MQPITDLLNDLMPGECFVVGSGTGVDLLLDSVGIDSQHARFVCRDEGFFVQDLDSLTGTFVNGEEVRGFIHLSGGDIIRLGNDEIILDIGPRPKLATHRPRLSAKVNSTSITLKGATKTISVRERLRTNNRTILDDVSFHVNAGEFVGVLGASGSGKSTMIKAIAGLTDLTQGTVLLGTEVASQHSLRTDQRIAYLPQDVVIHEALTPQEALGHITRLKMIGTSDADRDSLVLAALERVGVGDCLMVPIHRLSGGQRKRVALAAELLGDPQVILLDEATSGLDPATEAEMMQLFRSLADDGKSVICITHFPDRLRLCDRLVYLIDGKCVFYGPPTDLVRHFGAESIEDVYVQQRSRPPDEWREAFQKSPAAHVAKTEILDSVSGAISLKAAESPLTQTQFTSQTLNLLSRYFDLLRADWPNLLLLVTQAPVIGLMIALTFGSIRASFAELEAADTKEVIFVLVIAVLWCSGTTSVREIVKEQTILEHEMRFGVRLLPYLLSKVVLLSGLSLIQAFILLLVVRYFTELTGLFEFQFLVLGFTAILGVVLGLVVSTFAKTSERAMTILPVLLIGQAIFSGGLSRLEGTVKAFSQMLVPAYWGLDGIRSTFASDLRNATYPGAPGHFQPPILGPGGPLPLDLLALTLQGIALLMLAYLILNARRSGLSPREVLKSVLNWVQIPSKRNNDYRTQQI